MTNVTQDYVLWYFEKRLGHKVQTQQELELLVTISLNSMTIILFYEAEDESSMYSRIGNEIESSFDMFDAGIETPLMKAREVLEENEKGR